MHKNILFKLLPTLFLSLLSFGAYGLTTHQELSDLLSQSTTLKANFEQKTFDSEGKMVEVVSGEMQLKRPGSFSWHIKKPITQRLITDGKTFWNYEPDLQQVIIQPVDKSFQQTPAALLTDVKSTLENFHILRESSIDPDSKIITIKFDLVPKDTEQQELFDKSAMYFIAGKLRQIQIWDNLGHYTIVTLTKQQSNINISEKVFSLDIPEGIDVIRND